MNVEAAGRAVEGELAERSLEVRFDVEELEPERLRVDRDGMRSSAGGGRLADDFVGLRGLLSDDVDRALQDVAIAWHG